MTRATDITDIDTDKTKLAVIANTLTFIQKDINEIKGDIKDGKTMYLASATFETFKLDYNKFKGDITSRMVTQEDFSVVKKLVLGAAGLILTAFIYALATLLIKK